MDISQHPRIANANPLVLQLEAGGNPKTVVPDSAIIVRGGQSYMPQPGDIISAQMGWRASAIGGGIAMNTIPITYGEFYDVPRMIRFQLGGKWYFMRSRFDEEKDDYSDFYEVYLLPFHSEDEFKSNPNYWAELNDAFRLGQIPITEVGLDPTRRRSIDADSIESWLSRCRSEPE